MTSVKYITKIKRSRLKWNIVYFYDQISGPVDNYDILPT